LCLSGDSHDPAVRGRHETPDDVEGVVEMMLDATRNYDKPLTEERLFGWHASLFPTGHSGMRRIAVGAWRRDSHGPMQVVSGAVGKDQVHFEAPGAPRLEQEMTGFLDWFNGGSEVDPVLKAGIAHLWFVKFIPSTTATGASPARLPTYSSPGQKRVRSVSTACRRRSGRSAKRITTSLSKHKRMG